MRLTDAELAEMRPAREVLSVEEFAAVTSVRKAPRDLPSETVREVPERLSGRSEFLDVFLDDPTKRD